MGPTELATSTFGQGYTVTMVQQAAAFSSLINGGNYYQPHVMERVLDENGKVIQSNSGLLLKQTISSGVSELLRSYLAGSAAPGFPDRLAAGYSFEEYNDCIREACARAGGRLVDMAATGIAYESLDGAHPTAVGHRELARAWLRAMGE